MSVKYMCDSCGYDCLDEAFLINIQEMAHPMRHPTQGSMFTKTPNGIMPEDGRKQFMICSKCLEKTRLPNLFDKDDFKIKEEYKNG